ncbi:hypothetical protein GWK47_035484 [Chionoecetes opilio]|uniref:Uncharacterized protein n=1 Tax=Chionoecetes opilio TaxID=41210 RepID=A0A8J4YN78_CHIOP|nr:hypothetical protein GWK47_035484 [Chionoecetes opilio]
MEILNVSRRHDIKYVVEDKNKSLDLRHLTLEKITASGNLRPTPRGKQDQTERTIALTRYGRCRCHCRRPSCCCYLLPLLSPVLLLLLHVKSLRHLNVRAKGEGSEGGRRSHSKLPRVDRKMQVCARLAECCSCLPASITRCKQTRRRLTTPPLLRAPRS